MAGAIEYRLPICKRIKNKYRLLTKLRTKLRDNNIVDIQFDNNANNDNEYFIIRKPGRTELLYLISRLMPAHTSPTSVLNTVRSNNTDKEIILKILPIPCLTDISFAFKVFELIDENLQEDIEINLEMLKMDKFVNRRYLNFSTKLRNSKRIAELFIDTVSEGYISDFGAASPRLLDNDSLCVNAVYKGFTDINKLSVRLQGDSDFIKRIYDCSFGFGGNLGKNIMNILSRNVELRREIVIFILKYNMDEDIDKKQFLHSITKYYYLDDKLVAAMFSINFEWYKLIDIPYDLNIGGLSYDIAYMLRIIKLMKISKKIAKQMFKLMDPCLVYNIDIVAEIIKKNKKAFKYIPYNSYIRRNKQIITLLNTRVKSIE